MNSIKKSEIETIINIFRTIDRIRGNYAVRPTLANSAREGREDLLILYSALLILIILNELVSSKNSAARPLKDNRVPQLLDKVSKIYEILMS